MHFARYKVDARVCVIVCAILNVHKGIVSGVRCVKMSGIETVMGSMGISTGSRSPILANGPLLERSEALIKRGGTSPQSVIKPIPSMPVGCSAASGTKTVITMGNFEGDSTRMQVVLDQSRDVAATAANRGNIVCYAVMGNMVPDVHQATSGDLGDDSLSLILKIARNGHTLKGELRVNPENVTLMVGTRELAWLRLANKRQDMREIAPFDDPDVEEVLKQKTPFDACDLGEKLPSWHAHNQSLELLHGASPEVAAVCMLLKLVSMAQMTMNAPGLVRSIAKKMQPSGDAVAYMSLFKFLETYDGSIKSGIDRLINLEELTMEGLGVLPAAKDVVGAVLSFADTEVIEYLRKGKLAHCITSGHGGKASGGLWLCALGDEVVRKMPLGVKDNSVDVLYGDVDVEIPRWESDINKLFQTFCTGFEHGDVDEALYKAFVAMSIAPQSSCLPLAKLFDGTSTCSGVCINNSTPFGTIQRRVVVDGSVSTNNEPELSKITECWAGINTDAYTPSTYWSIATWCAGTVNDLSVPPPLLNKSEKISTHLYNVSITLASLLSTHVGSRRVVDYDWKLLNGLLGPVVTTSANGNQIARVVSFTHEAIDTAFVILLPEAFIQESLDYKNYATEKHIDKDSPFIVVEGFLALPDDAAVPLDLPGLSVAEVEGIRNDLGTRVWALPKRRSNKWIASFTRGDHSAIAAMQTYTVQKRPTVIPGYEIFHTHQNLFDPFSGLNVSLVQSNVPGKARMTLDTDTSAYQALFRVVKCG